MISELERRLIKQKFFGLKDSDNESVEEDTGGRNTEKFLKVPL